MAETYIRRSLEPVLRRAAAEFPGVVLTGPRQSGKTTLLKYLYGDVFRYVSLEAPDVRAAAREDPRGFLAMHAAPVIFDEIQHAPDLLPYVKEAMDAQRHRPGQYLLTGSQNLLLAEKVTESLAGRVAVLRLLPLARREAEGPPPESAGCQNIWAELVRGSYPELVANPGRDVSLWYASYVQTYLERDVRTIRQVGDLHEFHSFLRILAARNGQLLHLTDL